MNIQIISNINIPDIRLNKNNQTLLKKLVQLLRQAKIHFEKNIEKIEISNKNINNETIKDINNFSHYPNKIQNHILELTDKSLYTFNLSLHKHQFKCNIILEKEKPLKLIMDEYVKYMYYWLFIATSLCNKKCSSSMNIYIFATSLMKELPEDSSVLSHNNCNTAFTTSCNIHTDLHLFRKEEWFKVFIHETFHNLGLDFSGIDNISNSILQKVFAVNSDIRAYESYTEIFAELIIVLMYCSEKTNAQEELIKLWKQEMKLEQQFSLFQAAKILKHYDLNYTDLFKKQNSIIKYAENTQVFSYYILKLILIYHINDFLEWCVSHNNNIVQFKQTEQNIVSFCQFLIERYDNPHLISHLNETKNLVKNNSTKLMKTLRMTIHNFP